MKTIDTFLDFWFGDWDDDQPLAEDDRNTALWFRATPALDEKVREVMGEAHFQARRGELDPWTETPRGSLALTLLLDQVPRHIHRGTPDAHATDSKALAVASAAVDTGQDRQLAPIQRGFLYLPFMHAEDLAVQDRSVALYTQLAHETRDLVRADHYASKLVFAEKHRAVIQKFGRYPSRNHVLGRPSTEEELAFMAEHGPGW